MTLRDSKGKPTKRDSTGQPRRKTAKASDVGQLGNFSADKLAESTEQLSESEVSRDMAAGRQKGFGKFGGTKTPP